MILHEVLVFVSGFCAGCSGLLLVMIFRGSKSNRVGGLKYQSKDISGVEGERYIRASGSAEIQGEQ